MKWLRGLGPLAFTAALAFAFPFQRMPATVVLSKLPPRAPAGELVLADDAAPQFGTASGRDVAFFRAWLPGHGDLPLHVVALDCATWSVLWNSDPYPATVDRGTLLFELGAQKLHLDTFQEYWSGQKHHYVLNQDNGALVSDDPGIVRPKPSHPPTPLPERGNPELIQTEDHAYSLTPTSLSHQNGEQQLYSIQIAGIGAGSHLGWIGLHGKDLVIVANDAIFIVDPANGQLKKRIDSF